ncbi:uncharacterized protein MONBRDRAFT_26002 [Monosiga brevicollis MX1]|uniref:Actin-fragmin kinase catalytic domain-containing protein n=1 Tax=Monosiga brevicollis TaxID=81824 RepID=A9V132_MONBE|nr:uncharacterized protein MONBRDRAFT_26002 [Monosiga brevicollis MX1]EDQ88737.1 predicted protein [Monosiga brevicollis MX1]|eukprot:XP_001746350.1 hypothetical protein [Monosiga brevicollis MX1]
MASNTQDALTFDPRTAQPAPDVQDLNLKKFKLLHWSEGGLGSTGVFFVLGDSGWFVMKPVMTTTAGEVYGALLGPKIGVSCPELAPCPDYSGQEELITRLSFTRMTNPGDKPRLKNDRVNGFTIMSYVPGIPLASCAMLVLPEQSGPQILQDLGHMMVLDLVINNHDRVPLAHHNSGNLANVMLKGDVSKPTNDFRAVSIDQGAIVINHDDMLQKYREDLRQVTIDMKQENYTSQAFDRVRKCFVDGAGHELTKDQLKSMREGFSKGIEELQIVEDSQPKLYEETLAQTKAILGGTGRVLACGLDHLDANFFRGNALVVLEAWDSA